MYFFDVFCVGKSTLLMALLKEIAPESGFISYPRKTLVSGNSHEKAQQVVLIEIHNLHHMHMSS